MAFRASKTSHNSRTKHYFVENVTVEAVTVDRNSYLHLIDPRAAVAVYTDGHTHKHTTVYLACACAPEA